MPDKEYMKEYMLRRYHKRRAHFLELLGNECVECGDTEDLEFDHIDPHSKKFSIGKRLVSAPMDVLEAEILGKCQLLCAHHHRLKSKMDSIEKRYSAV